MNTELQVITKTLPIININFDEVEKELQELLASYKGLVFTEETEKEGKEVQKKLAKLSKDIDRRRIDIKKEVAEPIMAFEARCNKLTAMVDEVNAPIKQGLQVFETKRKEDKADQIRKYIALKIAERGLLPKYSNMLVVHDRYLNTTATMKVIKEDIDIRSAGLEKQQLEEERAEEAIYTHVQEMNDLLDLAQPLDPAEFKGGDYTELPAILARITQKARERKASEEAALERQRAKEEEAYERARVAEQLRQEAAAALNMPAPQPVPIAKVTSIIETDEGVQITAKRIMDEPQPSRPRFEALKRRNTTVYYTLTVNVSAAQLNDLENYLTDNLIQTVNKVCNYEEE